jgi:anti-sigma-K factor RskA
VTFATGRLEEATLTRAALATTFTQARAPVVSGPFWRAAVVVGDLVGAVAIVLCIPFVILAIGIPMALCVRLLLWIGGLL